MRAARNMLIGLSGIILTPANAETSPRQLLSPAGEEIVKAVYAKPSSDLIAIIAKRQETRRLIELQLQTDQPDWKVLAALLDQDFADDMRLRQLSQAIEHDLIAQLPEADRIIWLRERYATPAGPAPVLVPPQR